MSFFKKLKKVFKSIVNIITAPVQTIINVAAKVVAPVLRAVAEIEGLVYNGMKQIADSLAIGPSFVRNLALRLNQISFDSAMFSNRGQLGVGLLALGAASNNKAMRTEGRLELLSATLFFARASGMIPQWLMMIVMVFIAIFFFWAAVIIMMVFVGVYLVTKFEIPKLSDDPDLMLKHLMMLAKYGLLDGETTALLKQYAIEKSKTHLYDESVMGPIESVVDTVYVDIRPILENIRNQLQSSSLPPDGTVYVPGPTTPPPAEQPIAASSSNLGLIAALGIGLALARMT